MPCRNITLPTLALMAAFGGGALAQTAPSSEQARSLETQITAWLKQVTAGTVSLPARPVELTPEGDHFLVRVPFAAFGKVQPADAAFTAKARAIDGTRWALDDQRFPSDVTFSTTEDVPDAPDAKDPSSTGTHSEPVTYHLVFGQQDVHGVFDPTYTTPTTSGGTIASLDMTKTGGIGPSTTHIGRFTTQNSSQPLDPKHLNILADGTAADYALKTELTDGNSFGLTAAQLHVMSSISGLAHDQVVPVIQTLAELGRLSKAKHDDADGPTPAEKAQLRILLTRAHALLTGAKVDESMEGAKFDFSGTTGSFDKVQITFGADAPQDMMAADLGFTLDGLKVDGLPPSMAIYLPTHLSIHPTVSNISVSALTKMGMDATAPVQAGKKAPVPEPDLQRLFANGGINLGFDRMDVAVVGTTISGTGKFVAKGPQSITGQAEFTAHGLDALVTKMQADPLLAPGVPVVIFLKGIARTTGDQAVWQVSVNGAKILVNGVDLSAMAGAFNK